MTEWRPIETAPHNVQVLLYCPDRGVANGARYSPRGEANWARIEIGYASQGTIAGTRSLHSWATHWMPLPEPPR